MFCPFLFRLSDSAKQAEVAAAAEAATSNPKSTAGPSTGPHFVSTMSQRVKQSSGKREDTRSEKQNEMKGEQDFNVPGNLFFCHNVYN